MTPHRRRLALLVGTTLLASSVLTACTVSIAGGLAGGFVSLLLVAALLGLGTTSGGCETSTDDGDVTDVRQDTLGPCLGDVGVCLSVIPDDTVGPCLGRLPDDTVSDIGVCLQPPFDTVGPCLGPLPDDTVGPCLTRVDVEPCLGVDIGVCLEPPLDTIGPCLDYPPDVGPCLSPPPPDVVGPCLDQIFDVGPCLSRVPPDAVDDDTGEFGPCLSVPPPEASAAPQPGPPQVAETAAPGTRADAVTNVLARGGLPADVAARIRGERPEKS